MRTELFVTTLIDTWIPGERVVDRAGCLGHSAAKGCGEQPNRRPSHLSGRTFAP